MLEVDRCSPEVHYSFIICSQLYVALILNQNTNIFGRKNALEKKAWYKWPLFLFQLQYINHQPPWSLLGHVLENFKVPFGIGTIKAIIDGLGPTSSVTYLLSNRACHWAAIAGDNILVPCDAAKSLQLIGRSGTVDEIYGCPIFKWVAVT